MCLHPLLVKNPNYGKNPIPGSPFSLKDCSSQYIKVPCGKCSQCIAFKQLSLIQRLQMESLENHLFFASLTYNNEMIPTVTASSGFEFRYSSYDDLRNMMKRIRNDNLFGRPFKYFAVSERGSKRSRPHFHIIFIIPKFDGDDHYSILNLESSLFQVVLSQWKRKVGGSKRSPIYKPLCTYIRKYKNGKLNTTFDLHFIRPLPGDSCLSVAFYVLKYMLKPSTNETRLQQALRLNLPEDEYNDIWKLVRSRYFVSKDFGSSRSPKVRSFLKDCIKKSIKSKDYDFPLFFNPDTGSSFPLARFYRSKGDIYSFDDACFFYWKHGDSDRVDTVIDNDDTPVEIISNLRKQLSDYERIVSNLEVPGIFDDCDDLFD